MIKFKRNEMELKALDAAANTYRKDLAQQLYNELKEEILTNNTHNPMVDEKGEERSLGMVECQKLQWWFTSAGFNNIIVDNDMQRCGHSTIRIGANKGLLVRLKDVDDLERMASKYADELQFFLLSIYGDENIKECKIKVTI